MRRVRDFRPASRNTNKHTARGLGALENSIRRDGWIGAMTTAADGEIIAGSARLEKVVDVMGTEAEPIVIESDGSRPIVVVRTDIAKADDPRAQRLAVADNRVQEIDLSWNVEILAGLDAETIEGLWSSYELSQLGEQWANQVGDKPEDEWQGMPEFHQENAFGAIAAVKVHFATLEDIEAFAQLVQQTVTDKTRFLWYPKQEKMNLLKLVAHDES